MSDPKYKDNKDDEQKIEVPDNLQLSYIVASEARSPGMHPKRIHTAQLLYHSHSQDLALLHINVDISLPKHGYATIAKVAPEIGEQLEMVGNVSRQYFSYRVGVVSSYRDTMDYGGARKLGFVGPFMQASALVAQGDSGGGAFNTDGELVGIASFIDGSAPGIVYYVALSTIKNAIASVDKSNIR